MEGKELEVSKQGLTNVKAGAHCNAVHWDTKYSWIQDQGKNIKWWKEVQQENSKKLKEILDNWTCEPLGGAKPPLPDNTSLLVWNSFQKFKGVSMNDLLLKGLDVLNPFNAVLISKSNNFVY